MKLCIGVHCPNKKQCGRWIKNRTEEFMESIKDSIEIINKCLNNKEFIRND